MPQLLYMSNILNIDFVHIFFLEMISGNETVAMQ